MNGESRMPRRHSNSNINTLSGVRVTLCRNSTLRGQKPAMPISMRVLRCCDTLKNGRLVRLAGIEPTALGFGGRYSIPVSYTHLRAHETRHDLVCRLLL